jgi:hypothetical protein
MVDSCTRIALTYFLRTIVVGINHSFCLETNKKEKTKLLYAFGKVDARKVLR